MTAPQLGQRARDIVTGIEGIIIGKSEWLTGCNTYGIKPKIKDDGTNPDCYWVDEARVDVLDAVSILESKERQIEKDPGGPSPTPRQNPDQ